MRNPTIGGRGDDEIPSPSSGKGVALEHPLTGTKVLTDAFVFLSLCLFVCVWADVVVELCGDAAFSKEGSSKPCYPLDAWGSAEWGRGVVRDISSMGRERDDPLEIGLRLS